MQIIVMFPRLQIGMNHNFYYSHEPILRLEPYKTHFIELDNQRYGKFNP